MKRKELNYQYFEELRVSLKELYDRSINGYNFKNLKKLIMRKDNFLVALREISYKRQRETSGLDGLKFSDIKYKYTFEEALTWFNDFKEQPLKIINILTKEGKRRNVGINNISDRIIQQMVYNVLEPICEGKFKDSSFGFRREVSAKDAIHKLVRHGMTNTYAVKIDLMDFFDEIPHWKVIQCCYDIGIHDKWVLKLIKTILKSPLYDAKGNLLESDKGIRQGGILSPLLSNIVLHEFDSWFLDQWVDFTPRTLSAKKNFQSKVNSFHLKVPTGKTYKINFTSIWRGKKVFKTLTYKHQRKIRLKQGYLIRYVDDIVIVCKNNKTAIKWKYSIIEKLNRMGLKVQEDKCDIIDMRLKNISFLGYEIKMQDGTQRWKNRKIYHPIIMTSKENFKRIKEEARKKLKDLYYNRLDSFSYNSFIVSIGNYFDFMTFYWDTTKNLQNRIESRYRKLNGRNGWKMSHIPKKYENMKVHGISLERYKRRKVLWREYNGKIEVIHIFEFKKKEKYLYERSSFPSNRILWDKPSDHSLDHIFKTDWYKREKYMVRKNAFCEMYFPSLFSRQKGLCRRCSKSLYGLNTEVNHIIREDCGGTNDYSNLEILCGNCHIEETKEQNKIMKINNK